MKLYASEYFAGIGLVRMGLEACGWNIAFANNFSDKKFEMYKAFFPNGDEHYIIELAADENKDFFAVLQEIVQIYNRRLGEVETDLSLRIEVE